MRLATKIAAVGMGFLFSTAALASDPIVGHWQMSEDGQPKAVVKITQAGDKFVGVVESGQTQKAKSYVGRTVLMDVVPKGNGKYEGRAKDPRWGALPSVKANITLKGNSLTLTTRIKGSQTWQRK